MVTAVVDGHVHIHACYDLDTFFDQAHRNLSLAAKADPGAISEFFLLLTECAGDHYFDALRAGAMGKGSPEGLRPNRWRVAITGEDISLVVSDGARRLILVAGRQVACREGLEVLLLGTNRRFVDRRPILEVLGEGAALGLLRVIPWGAGKWFFGRARLLSELLRTQRDAALFLGDEGGRPGFWPYPRHFREGAALGVRDLPGTDPLPFPHDIEKVGRMGFRKAIEFDPATPGRSLLQALRSDPVPLERFARLEPPVRFVRNQLAMQLRKHQPA